MTLFANVPLRARLLGAFGIVLTILVILASAAYRTTSINQAASGRVAHTLGVIGTANGVLASMIDMETGYRGFLLAGQDVFLEPYLQGSLRIDDQIAVLEALTADNPHQVERWHSVEQQLNEWRSRITEPGIALRRQVLADTASTDDLIAWVASGEGRRRFTALRATFNEALAIEQELLAEHQAASAAAGAQLQVVLIGGTILAAGLSVGLALLLTADVVGPIRRLAATAGEIASGQLDRRIGLRRGDEIGEAAAAFDRMTERLQTTIVQSTAILDTAAEGIVGLDRHGRVTFVNPAAAALLGLPEGALAGRDATAWIEPATAQPTSETDGTPVGHVGARFIAPAGGGAPSPVTAALASRTLQRGGGVLIRPGDGAGLPVEYACAPLQEAGSTIGAVVTLRDVTERLAAQQALEDRARELSRSNADLEQFAYVASHDLQEPLRAVVSYLQLLERRYGGQLDERAERYIGHAVEGGRRMQTLINDLLTYSRVGRRGGELTPVDLERVLQQALHSLWVTIQECAATVTHDPLPTVVADETQMLQLLQNLVGNAVKFRGEQPPAVHVSAERTDGAWRLSVRDNGIGIAPDYRERVFVLFQRLHGRDEYPGTGIGLAVCKKIVERHGGTLWVEDTPDGGSTFRFTIPDAGGTAT